MRTDPVTRAGARALTEALGAEPAGDGTRFSLFTTPNRRCRVRLFDETQTPSGEHALQAEGSEGYYSATIPGVRAGALYKFVLDDQELPDPYARFLPHGVHGPARVVSSDHAWRHPGVSRPLSEHIIYELHVGTFTESGTYEAATAQLDHVLALGATAIELMPLGAFPGARGWGYDGVAPFAPFAGYGTPDQLRAFVDHAHGRGLSVFLDVVYNHLGPDGNYLSAYSPDYFSRELKNAWGDAPNFGLAEGEAQIGCPARNSSRIGGPLALKRPHG